MTNKERKLIETITSQRGCLLDNHYAMRMVLDLLQNPLTKQSKERIIKLLKHGVRTTKKELCESKELSEAYDCEEGRLGIPTQEQEK